MGRSQGDLSSTVIVSRCYNELWVVPQSDLSSTVIVRWCYNELCVVPQSNPSSIGAIMSWGSFHKAILALLSIVSRCYNGSFYKAIVSSTVIVSRCYKVMIWESFYKAIDLSSTVIVSWSYNELGIVPQSDLISTVIVSPSNELGVVPQSDAS